MTQLRRKRRVSQMLFPSVSPIRSMRWSLGRLPREIIDDCRGVAGIEFALIGSILIFLTLNLVDVSRYYYTRMEVQNAAQIGAQAALASCDGTKVPATTMCSALTSAVTAAIQSTSLGSDVSLAADSPSEGYYCINADKSLQYMSDVSNKPQNCSAAGMPGLQPSDYLVVQVTYPYSTLFADLTVARLFDTPITASGFIRLK